MEGLEPSNLDRRDPQAPHSGLGTGPWKAHAALLSGLFLVVVAGSVLWLQEGGREPYGDSIFHMRAVLDFWLYGRLDSVYPPLVYYVSYPFLTLFGPGDLAFQMVQAAFLGLFVGATWLCGRRLGGAEVGFMAAVLLLCLPQSSVALRCFYLDHPLAALCLLQYWFYLESEGFRRPLPAVGFAALIPLAMLTKWAYVFCAGPFLLYLLVRFCLEVLRLRGTGPLLGWALAPFTLATCAVPWIGGSLAGFFATFLAGSVGVLCLRPLLFPAWRGRRPGPVVETADRFTRFLALLVAGVSVGGLYYAGTAQDVQSMASVNVFLPPATVEGLWDLALGHLLALRNKLLLPLAFWLVAAGALWSLLSPEGRRRNAELLLAWLLPGTAILAGMTVGLPRYFVPLLAFHCLVAASWLARLGNLRWVPVGLVVLWGLCFSVGWATPLPLARVRARTVTTELAGFRAGKPGHPEGAPRLRGLWSGPTAWSRSLFFTVQPVERDWSAPLEVLEKEAETLVVLGGSPRVDGLLPQTLAAHLSFEASLRRGAQRRDFYPDHDPDRPPDYVLFLPAPHTDLEAQEDSIQRELALSLVPVRRFECPGQEPLLLYQVQP